MEAVTGAEIERILAITDAMGIHRESVVIPLPKRGAGQVRRRPDGKLEITAPAGGGFEGWLAGLEERVREQG